MKPEDKVVSSFVPGSCVGTSFPYLVSYERVSARECKMHFNMMATRHRRREGGGLLVTFMDSLSGKHDPAMRIDLRKGDI